MMLLDQTKEVIRTVSKKSSRAILFYSCGKDSIALLDLMASEFEEVICVFMYFVPGLEHIEKFIRFSENHYDNVRFIRVPHWTLSKIHSSGFFCAPQKVKQIKLSDVTQAMKIKTGIQYAFFGEKQADNLNRRIKLRQYEMEAISPTDNIYPLTHWKDADVLTYIEKKRLPKPINYGKTKNRSVGMFFDIDVYLYLREHYPQDLKKVLQQYPLSEKLLFDYDRKENSTKSRFEIQAKRNGDREKIAN